MGIRDFLAQQGVDIAPSGHGHTRPGWVQVDCPFCGPRTQKYHLGINEQGVYANCWKCGPHRLGDVLEALLHCELKEAIQYANKLKADRPVAHTTRNQAKGKVTLPEDVHAMSTAHRRYLRQRGFNPREIERLWSVQGIRMLNARLRWRLFIPFVYRGETVSWITRAITDNVTNRYISASSEEEAINHKHLLYGMDYCRNAISIHEGVTDAWRIGPGACATCGTSYTAEQIDLMVDFPLRIVCFDNEPEAQRRAWKLARQLSVYPGTTYNVVLDSKDVGSGTKKEIRKIRKLLHGSGSFAAF